MPYVKQEKRPDLDAGEQPTEAGDLVYRLTAIVNRVLGPKPRFSQYDLAVGAINRARLGATPGAGTPLKKELEAEILAYFRAALTSIVPDGDVRKAAPDAVASIMEEIDGACECTKLELYRRRIAKYEDKKIIENGDVYPQEE